MEGGFAFSQDFYSAFFFFSLLLLWVKRNDIWGIMRCWGLNLGLPSTKSALRPSSHLLAPILFPELGGRNDRCMQYSCDLCHSLVLYDTSTGSLHPNVLEIGNSLGG